MAKIIKGADVAAELKTEMRETIKQMNLTPVLAVIRVGQNDSDIAYERGIVKTCESVGITLRICELPEQISQQELEQEFRKINQDSSVHGILLFRPLPSHLNDKPLAQMIDPEKDMDCMSPYNWAKLVTGDESGYFPCTAEAVIRVCEFAGIEFSGARAVVLGRSQVIGKPVGLMLLSRSATVTWCHSRTKDLAQMCEQAQILVSACGVAGLVDERIARNLAPDCVAVDVGVNFKDGKMCGDFVFDAVETYADYITPVPGGVGAVTNTVLATHVVRSAVFHNQVS